MKKAISLILAVMLLSAVSFSQNSAARSKEFNLSKNNIGIQGYDPVAYFTAGKAVKGKKELAVYADGVTYYFSSAETKELFKKNYKAYEPQYGGWCAYAMGAKGEKVEVDPATFKILDGKLYLFYNAFFNNTLKSWNKDEVNLRSKADNHWKSIFH